VNYIEISLGFSFKLIEKELFCMSNEVVAQRAKKQRNELRLPNLHFVVVDDWLPKLKKSFDVWLQLHTMVDRTGETKEDYKIPRSMKALAIALGVTEPTLYSRLRPLWEYGLIDIIEYDNSQKTGQKPKNIVVYEYPFNEKRRETEPLVKERDWKTDYSKYVLSGSEGGKIGGKKSTLKKIKASKSTLKKIKGGTLKKIKGGTLKKIKANNVLNHNTNDSNTINNNSNNNSLSPEKEILHDVVDRTAKEFGYEKKEREEIIKHFSKMELDYINAFDIREQFELMETVDVLSPGVYFSNGMDNRNSSNCRKQKKEQEQEIKNPNRNTELYYNWLEEEEDFNGIGYTEKWTKTNIE
jgi:DNA-binding Lrp family transcriptional regulator